MIEKLKKYLPYVSALLIPALMLTYNVGYTKSEIDKKPSREQVKAIVDTAITKHEAKEKVMFVKIDQVPGLQEKLDAFNDKVDVLMKRLDKFEDKFVYGKK